MVELLLFVCVALLVMIWVRLGAIAELTMASDAGVPPQTLSNLETRLDTVVHYLHRIESNTETPKPWDDSEP